MYILYIYSCHIPTIYAHTPLAGFTLNFALLMMSKHTDATGKQFLNIHPGRYTLLLK